MVSRLERFTITPSNAVVARQTLLGSHNGPCPALSNTVDCIPSEGFSHSIVTVRSRRTGRCGSGVATPRASARSTRWRFAPTTRRAWRGRSCTSIARAGAFRAIRSARQQPHPRLHQGLGRRLPQPPPLQAAPRGRPDCRRRRLGHQRRSRPGPDRSGRRRPSLRLALLRRQRSHGRIPGSRRVRPRVREGGHGPGPPRACAPLCARLGHRGRRDGRAHLYGRTVPGELPRGTSSSPTSSRASSRSSTSTATRSRASTTSRAGGVG
jgi:hypothetical protein